MATRSSPHATTTKTARSSLNVPQALATCTFSPKMAITNGHMTPLEQSVYASLHIAMMDVSIQSDCIVYLSPPTETAFECIHSRARPGEEGIQCSLICKLAELHEAYLGSCENVYRMLDIEDADIEAMLSTLAPPEDGRGPGVHQLFPIRVGDVPSTNQELLVHWCTRLWA